MRLTTYLFGAILAMSLVSGQAVQAMPFIPDFNAAIFEPGAAIDNPYNPLLPNTLYIYRGEKVDGGETVVERIEILVTNKKRLIAGVQATVVRDRAFENGVLVEETFDWYAQDTAGNVWYMGEDSTEFIYDDDGNLIGTAKTGSWEAGVNDALPGFIMEAAPAVGDNYYQEFAPNDDALDQATVVALSESLSLGIGSFDDILKTFETSELEPDLREFKYYAPGIGLVFIEEELDQNDVPGFTIELISIQTVPEPGTLWLVVAALAVFAGLGRYRIATNVVWGEGTK